MFWKRKKRARKARQALDIISGYGDAIGKSEFETFYDASLLPASKAEIVRVLTTAILAAETEDRANLLGQGLIQLSWFRPGVGPTPVKSERARFFELSQAADSIQKESLAHMISGPFEKNSTEELEKEQEQEEAQLAEFWKEILAIRKSLLFASSTSVRIAR
jgi:hypothetical protein